MHIGFFTVRYVSSLLLLDNSDEAVQKIGLQLYNNNKLCMVGLAITVSSIIIIIIIIIIILKLMIACCIPMSHKYIGSFICSLLHSAVSGLQLHCSLEA